MNAKEKVALGSIAASAGLTVAKGAVGLLTGSLAILSEAAHSLIDLAATVMTFFAVRISGKPADKEHHYGHGKVESVTALAETALLFLLSAVVIWEAAQRLLGGARACGRGHDCGFRHHRRLDRGRFLPRAHAIACRRGDIEPSARSRRAAFQLGHVVVGRGAGRAWRRGARLFLGGLGRGHRGGDLHLRCRLAAGPAHHRNLDRHRARRRRRAHRRDRAPRARRRRGRARARAAGRSGAVRRSRRRGQPHAAARPRVRR